MKKKLMYFLAVMGALLAFVLLINSDWFDEDLLPEVQAIKDIKPVPYKPGNGYIGILALNSAPGPSFEEASERIREFLNNKIKQTGLDYLNDEESQALIGSGHDSGWSQGFPSCNGRKQLGCFEEWVDHIDAMNWNDARLVEQSKRYDALLNSTHFSEPKLFDWNSPFISYKTVMDLSKLNLAKAASQKNELFLKKLHQDAQFWQITFENSHFLIGKMVAIAALHHHIQAYSRAINQTDMTEEQFMALQNLFITPPLDASNMKGVFDFEFRYSINLMDEVEDEKSFFEHFDFIQPNALHNDYYRNLYIPLSKLTELDSKSFASEKANIKKAAEESSNNWSFSMLYNLKGKLYFSDNHALSAYTDYISRYHDLNIKWVLLKAQIDIALHPEQPIDQTLAESKFQNPITGQPFDYNPKDGTIGFDCLERIESNCRLQVH